jgi:hypothetical protein
MGGGEAEPISYHTCTREGREGEAETSLPAAPAAESAAGGAWPVRQIEIPGLALRLAPATVYDRSAVSARDDAGGIADGSRGSQTHGPLAR